MSSQRAVIDTASLSGEPVVGSAVEPGDEPGTFAFATPDNEAVKTSGFIAYEQRIAGDDEVVFARVTGREQASGLPTSLMADPEVSASRVAAALGADGDDADLYRITAEVIGYYDGDFESFRNPRQVPAPGTQIHRAPGEMLEVAVPNVTPPSRRIGPDPGLAEVGRLLNRDDEEVSVRLPVNEIAATHLAILASTGSGKSYTASVLLEEMLKPDTRASVLVFDPHDEYNTLDQMVDDERFHGENGYRPSVELRRPDQMSVKLSDLTYQDLRSILDPTRRMSSVLHDAHRDLQEGSDFSARDLMRACDDNHPDDEAPGLRWRINQNIIQSDFFTQYDTLQLDELVNPGQLTVLAMDGLSRRDQQMMAAVLLRKLYRAREAAVTGSEDEADVVVGHPVFTLFEEAHRFAPDGDSQALSIIRQVNSEGRKFGLGTGLISQRPSKLDQTVLSQCGTQITMQITNPTDQQAIRDAVESAGETILEELPGLTKGQAVIAGDAVNTPVLTKIRQRHTDHGAESLAADEEWRSAYDEAQSTPTESQPTRDNEGILGGEDELS